MPDKNAELLTEIREKYKEWTELWKPIRDEGKKDVMCIAGQVWLAMDPKGAEQRTSFNRPMIDADELNQYTNGLINDALSHPRAIKVTPRGFGANDQTASLRSDKIREIEYRSNATHLAYPTMFQNTVERSYGFARVNTKWEPGKWRQDLWIEPVVNPDLVTPDPWALNPDGSDMRGCFIHEDRDIADFQEGGEFSGAQISSFDSEQAISAPMWVRGNKIRVAEYWKVKYKPDTLLALKHPTDPNGEAVPMWKSDVPKAEWDALKKSGDILRDREEDRPSVCMYLTNGLEILKEQEWKGPHIPIISCFGKVLYVDDGSGAERRILSLPRLARSPFMLYCYYRTQQAEIAGMVPKVPVMVVKGQLRGEEYNWQKAPHEPLAFIEYHATTEDTGDQILPGPQRLSYEPGMHLQSLELCAEGARRAIQASMGAYALPTTAQRHNEKSGVALQTIKENTQIGNFHFMDHYDGAVRQIGVVVNENLAPVHDMPGPITVRTLDGKTEDKQINTPDGVKFEQGEHDVTVSVGPSLDSQREEANTLADALIGNQEVLQIIGPQKAIKLLATVVKMRNPGSSGELMASIIDPEGGDQSQQLQQENAMLKQHVQQVTQAATVMKQALDAKQVENQGRLDIERVKQDAESQRAALDRETKITVAELSAKVERLSLFMDERARLGAQAHETALAAADASHEQVMGDQQHQQTLDQQQQQADLQPPPPTAADAPPTDSGAPA